jgi:hypothetical protein
MIAVINESTVATDAEIESYLPALQTQITRDFGPTWGEGTTLQFFAKTDPAANNHWQVVVLDNADQAGALGYHDVTANDLPLSKVFAATDKQYNQSLSVTMSHEILEMLGDPHINMTATVEDSAGNIARVIAYEACDAVEADALGYEIDGVLVSDFMLPSWFDQNSKATKFDFAGHCTAPLQVLPGGYIGYWTPAGGWTQDTNGDRAYADLPQIGSRFERRSRGRRRWLSSRNRASA